MSEPIKAYPLQWPAGWKRTPPAQQTRARFHGSTTQYSSVPGGSSWKQKRDLTVSEATNRVLSELRTLGVEPGDAVISTNLVLRLDGLPRSDQRAPTDPGVAVYWVRPGETPRCMAIDIYDRVADNIAAVAASLSALRAIERHGGAAILDRAFTGFTALPQPGQTSAPGWRELFGFTPDRKVARSELDGAYRLARSYAHPDKPTGDAKRFDEIQKAYEQACQEIPA